MLYRFFFTGESSEDRFFQYVLGFQPSDGIMFLQEDEKTISVTVLLDARYATRKVVLNDVELQQRFGRDVRREVVLREPERVDQLQELCTAGSELVLGEDLPWNIVQKLESVYTISSEKENWKIKTMLQKTAWEHQQLAQAQEITLAIMKWIGELVESGKILSYTESGLRGAMFAKALSLGAEDESFPAIIATGAHSAVPHWQSSTTKIDGGPLLVDCGYRVNGYCGDCTRVRWVGEKTSQYDEWKRVLEIVQTAKKKAEVAVSVGVSCKHLDAIARNYIADHGYEGTFTHSLGHGVGLNIHEHPRLSSRSDDTLQSGMVFTVEPGIYLPGKFGVRWEDVVEV